MFQYEKLNSNPGTRNSERPRYDVYTTDDQHNRSAGWRDEYQSVEPTVLVTDSGRFDLPSKGCQFCDHRRKNHLNDEELVVESHPNTRAANALVVDTDGAIAGRLANVAVVHLGGESE